MSGFAAFACKARQGVPSQAFCRAVACWLGGHIPVAVVQTECFRFVQMPSADVVCHAHAPCPHVLSNPHRPCHDAHLWYYVVLVVCLVSRLFSPTILCALPSHSFYQLRLTGSAVPVPWRQAGKKKKRKRKKRRRRTGTCFRKLLGPCSSALARVKQWAAATLGPRLSVCLCVSSPFDNPNLPGFPLVFWFDLRPSAAVAVCMSSSAMWHR